MVLVPLVALVGRARPDGRRGAGDWELLLTAGDRCWRAR
jgi:hypothetical protein